MKKTYRSRTAGHRARLRATRAVVNSFAANEYEMADMDTIYEAVRRQVNILDCMGVTEQDIIRAAERQWIHDVIRDHKERIDGTEQRTFQWDGAHWVHLPGKLWMHTREPQTPDADIRRKELTALLDAIISRHKLLRDGENAVVKGLRHVKAEVKAGKQFEQPALLSEDNVA